MTRLLACLALTASLSLSAAAAETPAVGVKVPAHQRFVLPNGLTVVLMARRDVRWRAGTCR
jgi:hypothetical protein